MIGATRANLFQLRKASGSRTHRSKHVESTSNSQPEHTIQRARRRWVGGVFLALVLLSIPIRLQQLNNPLVGRHRFRQTQTAITVWQFVEDGVHPLAYSTPVFGPPWRVPMEFPSFQLAAFIPARLGMEIDSACRLTNMVFFYISALLLFLLCRTVVPGSRIAELSVTIFCWTPFTIYWSSQCLIDFAAVAFALGYTIALLKWLAFPHKIGWFASALMIGVVAYLTKVTTLAAFLPMIGGFFFVSVSREIGPWAKILSFVRNRWKFLAGAVLLVLLPVLAEHAWVVYSDHVKAGSPYTAWLTSENLADWNFGSLDQRRTLSNWKLIGDHIGITRSPAVVLLLTLLGILGLRHHDIRSRFFFLTAAAGIFFAVVLFFNLYLVHEYYLIAVTVPLAIAAGFGADFLLFGVLRKYPVALLCVIAFVGHTGLQEIFPKPKDFTLNEYRFARLLREITAPDELLVVAERDWNPSILYWARRRGFMLRGKGFGNERIDEREITRFLKTNGFSVIVTASKNHWLTKKWLHRMALPSIPGYFVYRVSDQPISSGPYTTR